MAMGDSLDAQSHRASRADNASIQLDISCERYSSNLDRRVSQTHADAEAFPEPQIATFDTAKPRTWRTPISISWSKVYQQLLGFNPFESTYLSLYDPLDTIAEKAIAISSAVFAIAAGVPLPVIGYIFGQIINEFPPPEDALYQRLVQLLGVAVAYFGVTVIYTIGFGLTAENVSVKLRRQLLECLLHLDQAYLDTHDIDVNGYLTERMDTIQAGCSEKVGIFIQAMSYFVASFVVGFILDAKLTGILLISVVPAIALSFAVLSPAVSRASRAVSKQNEKANDIVESALGAVKVVQAFDMIGEICRRHLEYMEQSTRSNVKKAVFAAAQSGSVYFIAYAANALAFYIGSRIASGGNAGTVYAVVFLILDASFVVGQFAPFLEIFARAAAAKGTIQDLLDARKHATNAGTYHRSDNKPSLHDKDIAIQGVEFMYPARPTVKTLDGVDLTFRASTFTAVVGTSGGGKSTLVALLLGIYDYSGRIMVGSEDVKNIDSNHLRSQIAVLDQDTILFTGSLFDNVCYGLMGQTLSEQEKEDRCQQALKDANVDFLKLLPHGVHTVLGNETQLSGGQRQRVCLARALIKRPAVLILDEPTSALDARSEVAVMDAVKNVVANGTTVIMIAHRLSTTLNADHVAVMSNGKVVEQGSPRELSVEGTLFRGLLDAQKTNFEDRDTVTEEIDPLNGPRTKSAPVSISSADDAKAAKGRSEHGNKATKIGAWELFRRIGSTARPEVWLAAAGLIASTISGGILLGQALIFGQLVNLLNQGRALPNYESRVDFFSLMFFVLSLIALASYMISGTAFGVTSTRLTGRVQARMLHKILHLDMQWFAEPGHSTHRLMEAFTKDPGDVSAVGGVALGAIFTIFTSVIGGIILAHIVAWKIAVVLLAAVPIMLFAGYARLRILTASEIQHREAYSGATSLAAEACRKRRAVTALCLEEHIVREYHKSLREPYRKIRNFVFYANTLLSFCFSVTYFVYALAYWWGSKQVRNGTYNPTDFFTVLPALLFSAQSAGHFFSLSPEIARAKTAARSIFGTLDARSTILPSDEAAYVASTTSSMPSLEKAATYMSLSSEKTLADQPKLEFSKVSLSYPNASRPSLIGVDLRIGRGQTVAFVGPSGAGKSSAMALIERFHDTTEGELYFDGVNIRDLDVKILRSHMGFVSQDPDLFSGSILYNVRLGASSGQSVTDADVEEVCRKCGLHDFIMSLPDGYNTQCGSSSSSQLSGGQKQRVAIARALVRDPEVLLLDEPTSALDAHSEAVVQTALAEAAEGRTTVMVAHRLASTQHVDQIFVFEHGKLVAQGTHADLVEQGGLYASMAKAQSLT